MAKGPRVRGKTAVRRVPLSLKVRPEVRAILEKAADRSGRSLAAEVEFRVYDYESLRSFVDRLLDDGVTIDVIHGIQTARKIASTKGIGVRLDNNQSSLERAIVTAACLSKLFGTVATHAASTLARDLAKQLAAIWRRGVETGEIAHDFDVEDLAADVATKIAAYASMSGTRVAVEDLATTLGPFIWDVCFDKGDPLRSTSIGTGREIMGVLPGSRFSLPETFMAPPSEDDRLAFVKKLKNSATIRRAAESLKSEGKHPEMSEDEVVDMLCRDLLAHTGLNLSEVRSDATPS